MPPRHPVHHRPHIHPRSGLLMRLLIDSVLPCALVALALVIVLTVQQARLLDLQAQAAITGQLNRLSGLIDSGAAPQALLDRAMRDARDSPLRRIELHQADGSVLHSGASSTTALQDYRQQSRDAHGARRTLILRIDPLALQRAHWRSRGIGVACALGIVLLALLATTALRHHVLRPLRQLQSGLRALRRGCVTQVRPTASTREFGRLEQVLRALSRRDAHDEWPSRHAAPHLEPRVSDPSRSEPLPGPSARFIASIGHHFRQPLQALELLSASLHHDPERRAALLQMRTSIDRMTRLLDALLEISRLDAGVIVTTPTVFTSAELFLHDRAAFNDRAARQAITLHWHSTPHALCGDHALAAELLHQLIGNALAHAPCGHVLVAARRRGDTVRIEVRDNGPGIAVIDQSRIFEAFVQLPDAATRHPDGYGLGLTLAQRLAGLLGTRVGVRSAPGRGSTFWFELPRVARINRDDDCDGDDRSHATRVAVLKHAC